MNAGDVLGIHYADKQGHSVVMYEDGTKFNYDPQIPLSTTVTDSALFDATLTLGHQFMMSTAKTTTGKRAPALFPVFNRSKFNLSYLL